MIDDLALSELMTKLVKLHPDGTEQLYAIQKIIDCQFTETKESLKK